MIDEHGTVIEEHGLPVARWKRALSYLFPVHLGKSIVHLPLNQPEPTRKTISYHGCATFIVNRKDEGEYVLDGIIKRDGKVFYRLMEKDSDRVFLLNKDLFQRLFRKKEG